jgi:hypothetical protein
VVIVGTASYSAIVIALPCLRDNHFSSLKKFDGGTESRTLNRMCTHAADRSPTPPLVQISMSRQGLG